jgi:streptomycin 3"-adenylyltransferase
MTTRQLEEWRHPSPFEFHYGESHRDAYALEPVNRLETIPSTDSDLAAHVTIAHHAGVAAVGPPPGELLPDVPFGDCRDALGKDLQWARNVRSALYGVLSPCRVWATLATQAVHSKASGAAWALERMPDDLKPLVQRALASYTGAGEPIDVDEAQRQRLLDYVESQLPE